MFNLRTKIIQVARAAKIEMRPFFADVVQVHEDVPGNLLLDSETPRLFVWRLRIRGEFDRSHRSDADVVQSAQRTPWRVFDAGREWIAQRRIRDRADIRLGAVVQQRNPVGGLIVSLIADRTGSRGAGSGGGVEDSVPAAQYRVLRRLIREAKPRLPVVRIHGEIAAVAGGGELLGPVQLRQTRDLDRRCGI